MKRSASKFICSSDVYEKALSTKKNADRAFDRLMYDLESGIAVDRERIVLCMEMCNKIDQHISDLRYREIRPQMFL